MGAVIWRVKRLMFNKKWWKMPRKRHAKLVEKHARQLNVVIEAKGGKTKY